MNRRSGQLAAAVAAFGVALTGCGSDTDGRSPEAAGSSAPGSYIAMNPGEPAIWALAEQAEVGPTTTKFPAVVTRLGCNGGKTGGVLDPVVSYGQSQVTVFFSVDGTRRGGGNCPGNQSKPYTVVLEEPIGDRQLVDAQCLPGGPGDGTADCPPDGVRWSP